MLKTIEQSFSTDYFPTFCVHGSIPLFLMKRAVRFNFFIWSAFGFSIFVYPDPLAFFLYLEDSIPVRVCMSFVLLITIYVFGGYIDSVLVPWLLQ